MWLTNLKIAIIEKDTDKLNKLMDELPQLKKKEEIEQAVYLLKEASELVNILKDETANSMKQIKKNLQFLHSTDTQAPRQLDIKS